MLGDCEGEFGGTSASTPQVAGVVALMLEKNPNLNWKEVQTILIKTSKIVDQNNSGKMKKK